MKVVFIANEQAGSGKGALVWQKLKSQLTIPYIAHTTDYAGHAIQLAAQYTTDSSENILLLAVGGDGTVHEVIEGAAGHPHISIGAMKAGSGNDFARGYYSFEHVVDIENYYNNSKNSLSEMDLGSILLEQKDPQSFVNNAGIGFDAYITTKVNQSKLKSVLNYVKLGQLSYMLLTIWALFTFKRFNAKVSSNGKNYTFRNVWFISICNQPFFGGGMRISPHSKPNDQQLELTVVHDLSRIKLLLIFLTVFWGKHERFKEVTMLQGNHFSINVDAPTLSHVDGELLGYVKPKESIACSLDQRNWYLAQY